MLVSSRDSALSDTADELYTHSVSRDPPAKLAGQLAVRSTLAHLLGGVLHGIDDVLIAGAPAQIAF